MAALKDFKVPADILKMKEDDHVPLLKKIEESTENRSSQEMYIRAYTTMIHLEETEQTQFIFQFNTKNIRIFYDSNRIFFIKNDVNTYEHCFNSVHKRIHFLFDYVAKSDRFSSIRCSDL